jgi:hypothetical protein
MQSEQDDNRARDYTESPLVFEEYSTNRRRRRTEKDEDKRKSADEEERVQYY